MPKGWLPTDERGFSLVEVILTGALFVLVVSGFAVTALYGQESAMTAGNRAQAAALAEEGVEAARNVRDGGYADLAAGTYGVAAGTEWAFSGSSDATGIFTRSVTVTDAGTNAKNVTSTVTWPQNAQRTGSVSVVTTLTDWLAALIGDWSIPTLAATVNAAGNQDGTRVQVVGTTAYVIRANSAPDFLVYDVTDPAAPVARGTATIAGTPRDLVMSGDYAYVTSNDNSAELQIVDVSDPLLPVLVGTFNAAGNADGNGVAVSGTYAYVVRTASANNEFVVVDVTDPLLPTLAGSVGLTGDGLDVALGGNYAYVSTSSNVSEVQTVDVTAPSAPTVASSLDLSGNNNALSIAAGTDVLVAGRAGGSLAVMSLASPSAPAFLGAVSLTNDVNGVALGNGDAYVLAATAHNTNEFKTVDISTPTAPAILGQLNAASALTGIFYDASADRAYATSSDNSGELIVLQPS